MAYATIDQLKNEVGIASSDTSQDSYLTDLLAWLTNWIDTYTRRSFSDTPLEVDNEVHDLLDNNKVWLNNTDIQSVTSVQINQFAPYTTLDPSAYSWNARGRLVIYTFPYSFPDLPRQTDSDFFLDYVRVSYTYGIGVPKAIEGACVEAAAKIYRNTNVEREDIGDYHLMFQRSMNGPADVFGDMGVLDAFRLRGV